MDPQQYTSVPRPPAALCKAALTRVVIKYMMDNGLSHQHQVPGHIAPRLRLIAYRFAVVEHCRRVGVQPPLNFHGNFTSSYPATTPLQSAFSHPSASTPTLNNRRDLPSNEKSHELESISQRNAELANSQEKCSGIFDQQHAFETFPSSQPPLLPNQPSNPTVGSEEPPYTKPQLFPEASKEPGETSRVGQRNAQSKSQDFDVDVDVDFSPSHSTKVNTPDDQYSKLSPPSAEQDMTIIQPRPFEIPTIEADSASLSALDTARGHDDQDIETSREANRCLSYQDSIPDLFQLFSKFGSMSSDQNSSTVEPLHLQILNQVRNKIVQYNACDREALRYNHDFMSWAYSIHQDIAEVLFLITGLKGIQTAIAQDDRAVLPSLVRYLAKKLDKVLPNIQEIVRSVTRWIKDPQFRWTATWRALNTL